MHDGLRYIRMIADYGPISKGLVAIRARVGVGMGLQSKRVSRLVIADPSLKDRAGHHFMTTWRLAMAARASGLRPMLAVNAGMTDPPEEIPSFAIYTDTIYQDAFTETPYTPSLGAIRYQIGEETVRLHKLLRLAPEDMIFFHTMTVRAAACVLESLLVEDPGSIPSYHILFRHDPGCGSWAGDPAELRAILTRLGNRGLQDKIFLYAETNALAAVYEELLDHQVDIVLHFPTADHIPARAALAGRRPRVAYLGEARVEKGFDALPAAIAAAYDRWPGGFDFICQTYASAQNAGDVADSLARLKEDAATRGYALHGELDQEGYVALLASCDIVIVAHRTPHYALRGSGIWVDAICSQASIVVRANTWMSSFLPGSRSFTFSSDAGVADAILAALGSLGKAQTAPAYLQNLFSVDANIDVVVRHNYRSRIKQTPPDRSSRGRNVLLVAPWWTNQGSSRVFRAQERMLRDLGYNVYALTIMGYHTEFGTKARFDWCVREMQYGEPVYHWISCAPPRLAEMLRAASARVLGREASWLAEMLPTLPVTVPDALHELIRQDHFCLIVCNYVAHLPIVATFNRANVPVIVETHDLRSVQNASTLGIASAGGDLAAELEMSRAASGLVFINQNEADHVARAGIAKPHRTLLPSHPLDLDRGWVARLQGALAAGAWPLVTAITQSLFARAGAAPEREDEAAQFAMAVRQFAAGTLRVCAFVGSAHFWNTDSISRFWSEIFLPKLRPEGVTLLLVGKIAAWFRTTHGVCDGVICVEWLSDLAMLYETGIPLILPITGGTGFPIKSLEALQSGSPVIGTPEAFRGFPALQTGDHVAEWDDFAAAILRVLRLGPAAPAHQGPTHEVLTWEYYCTEWRGLIEEVTGRAAPSAWSPYRADPKAPPGAMAAPPPLASLRVDGAIAPAALPGGEFAACSFGFDLADDEPHAWSVEPYFGFCLDATHRGATLRVQIVDYRTTCPEGRLALGTFVDGKAGPDFVVHKASLLLEIPLPAAGSGPILVEFFAPMAVRGLRSGGGADARALGIAISRLATGPIAKTSRPAASLAEPASPAVPAPAASSLAALSSGAAAAAGETVAVPGIAGAAGPPIGEVLWPKCVGFGGPEGPYPERGMFSKVRWAIKSTVTLLVKASDDGEYRVNLAYRCFLKGQQASLRINGTAAGTIAFENTGPKTMTVSFDVPLIRSSNRIELTFKHGTKETSGKGRELFVLVDTVQVEARTTEEARG